MHNKTTEMIFNEVNLDDVSKEDMHKANVLISEYVEHTAKHFPDEANSMKMHLYMVLSGKIPYEMAKMATDNFINEDGTTKAHWDYETTKAVKEKLGYDFDCVEWYFALNKVYSDYYSPDFADEVYFKMACQYLKDKDGSSDKVKHDILMML